MKKALLIAILSALILAGCGQVEDAENNSKAETTTVSTLSAQATTTESTEKTSGSTTSTTSETTSAKSKTTTTKSSQKESKSTTTKKSADNSAKAEIQSNNGDNTTQQNTQHSVNTEQSNQPAHTYVTQSSAVRNTITTTRRPVVTTTARPVTTTQKTTTTAKPKPVTTTTTSAHQITEEEKYESIGKGLGNNGSEYSKAEAVYDWMINNGSGTCVNYSWQTYYLCKGIGLKCYLAWTPSKLYGHVANVVLIDGTWFVLDTQGEGFLVCNDCGLSEIIDIDETYVADADLISEYNYDEI